MLESGIRALAIGLRQQLDGLEEVAVALGRIGELHEIDHGGSALGTGEDDRSLIRPQT